MDYEQKYKHSLSLAKQIYDSTISEQQKENISIIFPELKESEDEKIRKELLQAVTESEDSLYMVMTSQKRERLIDWLEKQGKQKSAWSEEDEKIINDAIWLIEHYATDGHKKLLRQQTIDKLKSLKPNHWKPSEEQLRAIINSVQGLYQCKEKEVLLDLYEQLKQL